MIYTYIRSIIFHSARPKVEVAIWVYAEYLEWRKMERHPRGGKNYASALAV
jgi:hypothetical protein